jgi:streptomycin 6-kinase
MNREGTTVPDLTRERLEPYLSGILGRRVRIVAFSRLGEGARVGAVKEYGYGTPVLVEYEADGVPGRVVVETTSPGPYGHEHMADRAQMILWDRDAYGRLPRHVRAVDAGFFRKGGEPVSAGDAEEFFLLVEHAEGSCYIDDLTRLQAGGLPTDLDAARANALCDYLVGIHAVRGTDPGLYARRIRELVGHGECIFGLADGYPDRHGFITPDLLESIELECVRWRWRLRGRFHRLRQVHGDFHPYNILFREGTDFTVLDRSRGEWGDPADDVTSLTGNYLFSSLQRYGRLAGPFETLFRSFWDRYVERSGDAEILEVCAPFFAFRCLVMASPVWYPTLDEPVRRRLFDFMRTVLAETRFDPARVDAYCGA